MTAKTPADLLDQAAELIEQRGKAVRAYEDRDGRLCALGALNQAEFGDSVGDWTTVKSRQVRKLLADAAGLDWASDIPQWNDKSDQSTVVATLRAAAAHARQVTP